MAVLQMRGAFLSLVPSSTQLPLQAITGCKQENVVQHFQAPPGKTGGACLQRYLVIGRTCRLTLGCWWLFCFVFVQKYFFPNKAERNERKGYPHNAALRRYMTVGRNIWIARGEVETALNDPEGFTGPESSTHCPTPAWNKNPWTTFNFCKKRVHFGDCVGQGLI